MSAQLQNLLTHQKQHNIPHGATDAYFCSAISGVPLCTHSAAVRSQKLSNDSWKMGTMGSWAAVLVLTSLEGTSKASHNQDDDDDDDNRRSSRRRVARVCSMRLEQLDAVNKQKHSLRSPEVRRSTGHRAQ